MKRIYHSSITLTPGTVSSLQDAVNSAGSPIDFTKFSLTAVYVQSMGGDFRYSVDQNEAVDNQHSPVSLEGEVLHITEKLSHFTLIPDSANPATEVSVTLSYVA